MELDKHKKGEENWLDKIIDIDETSSGDYYGFLSL